MRLRATEESLLAGEVSLLAIVETLGAMALTIWIHARWATYTHIAIGACVAPFLLLRTNQSCFYAVQIHETILPWFDRWLSCGANIANTFNQAGFVHSVIRICAVGMFEALFYLAFPISLLLVRVLAGIAAAFRHPVLSLMALPSNWRESVVSMDSGLSHCIIPEPRYSKARSLVREEGSPLRIDNWSSWHRNKQSQLRSYHLTSGDKIFLLFDDALSRLSSVAIWIPPYFYRWSLKSTAIVWFPLLWALRPAIKCNEPLNNQLVYQLRSDWFWLIRIASILAIAGFCSKIALLTWWSGFAEWWNSNGFLQSMSIVVQPTVIPKWQLVTVANSVLAIILWFYLRDRVGRIKHNLEVAEVEVRVFLSVTYFFRRLFTCYTIPCIFYLFAREAFSWNYPTLGDKWFPWL